LRASVSGRPRAVMPSPVPSETELKLAVPPATLPALERRLDELGGGQRHRLETTYYDTPDLLLARHGMALRLRRVGARWVQTLKTGAARGAFSVRGEWETSAPGGRLQLARLRDTPLPALLAAHGRPVLAPLFATRFTRSIRTAAVGSARIEVALDQGEVRTGRGRGVRRLALLELELELKQGRVQALFKLARQLMGRGDAALSLLPFSESKAARGYRLHAGRAPSPVKAAARLFADELRPEQPVDEALRHVVGCGTEVLLANVQGWADHDDPEFVHQARVALRRMRSALRLWRKRTAFPARLARDLQWIGRELGAARDADVLLLETLPHLAEGLPPRHRRALRRLTAAAQTRRAQARAHTQAALASARFARLALDLLAWAHAAPEPAGASLRKRAPRDLARALERLRGAALFFAALSPQRRHAVRILAKRLRYALDLFAVALPAAPTSEYLARLSALQDVLGELNDVAVAHQSLHDHAAGPELREAIGLRLRGREAALLHDAEAALHALFEAPPPWG